MRTARALAAAVAAGVWLAGCSSLPFGGGYTRDTGEFGTMVGEDAERLAPGQATDEDVLDALGPPSLITALPDGYAFLYDGGRLNNQSVGASIYSFRAAYAWSEAEFTIAAFVFDDDHRLTGRAVERREDATGRGFSIGTQRARAVDQAAYLVPAPPHFWGRSMLRLLPRTLGDGTNIDSGMHGLERRATTARVGQRTLEASHPSALALLELLRQQTGQ